MATGAGGADRLGHRLLRAHALEHGIGADAARELLDLLDSSIAAFGHDVRRTEFTRELLPRGMPAHRDDPLGAHLLGGEHPEQADRAVADHDHRRTGLDLGGIGGKPASAEHVGSGQQARDELLRRQLSRRDKRPIGERDAQQRRLRTADQLAVLARRLIAGLAVRACVVGREERSDDELTGLYGSHCTSDLLDDSHSTRGPSASAPATALTPRYGHRSEPHTQVAASRIDGIGGMNDRGLRALFEANVARSVNHCSSHGNLLDAKMRAWLAAQ